MSAVPRPVPIAFCITDLDRGGAERALSQLVLGLDRQAWLPRVYCLGPRGHFTDVLEAAGVTVECFGGRGLLSFPRVLVRLSRALRRFRPAVLQTFLFHANLVGRIAGRLAGVPIIVSGIRVADRRSRWYGRLDRWTNRLVNHNVCVSQGVADFAIREMGLPPNKQSVIPNGVNFELFANAFPTDLSSLGIRPVTGGLTPPRSEENNSSLGIRTFTGGLTPPRAEDALAPPGSAEIVITVGRLEEQKGIVHLLHAASAVLCERPECQFLIVGDGHDRASLEALAASLGIARSVWFLGSRSDVPRLLKAASVFVLASLWEGMPNALLEAMAAGLPVIATAVEGSREVIQSGENGLLVSAANPVELSQAILKLLSEPDVSARLARSAQLIVANKFAESGVVATYDSLYRRLMSNR